MSHTRIALISVALLTGTAASARAQQQTPRWGGEGNRTTAHESQGHPHVAYGGSPIIIRSAPYPGPSHSSRPRSSDSQATGGSWDGRRPVAGGSPPEQRGRQGATDLSGYFGYVPPRGETAQNSSIQPVQRASSQLGARAVATDTTQHHPRITWPR